MKTLINNTQNKPKIKTYEKIIKNKRFIKNKTYNDNNWQKNKKTNGNIMQIYWKAKANNPYG